MQHGEFLRGNSFMLLETGKTGGVISAVLPCLYTVNPSNQATVIKLFQDDYIIREGWEDAAHLESTPLITVSKQKGSTSVYSVTASITGRTESNHPN